MKLTPEQFNKLHDCLGSLQENILSAEDTDWLNDVLNKSEEAQELFLDYMRLSANMQWGYGTVPGDVDYPKEKLILGEPPNPELLKTPSPKRSKKQKEKESVTSSRKFKATFWVVLPLLVFGFFWSGLHLIQTRSPRELTEGTLELSFPTGSKVVVTAPATFIVTGDNSIRLLQGKLVADIPESGIGFQVDTPRGRVVDFGTMFSVHATKDLNTKVQVFRGKVVASLVDQQRVVQSSKNLEANQAIEIDPLKEDFVDIPYASQDFIATVQSKHGIVKHSKSVVFQEQMPKAVAEGKYQVFEHDDLVYVFPENKKVLLTKDLVVEIGKTGSYKTKEGMLKGKSFIPIGTTVDCFRVLYDPSNRKGQTLVYIQGEIHFDHPVLGIITSKELLMESDRLFHSLAKRGSDQKISYEGIEAGRQDKITLSKDRKTVSFHLNTRELVADDFRIIIQSQKDSPP